MKARTGPTGKTIEVYAEEPNQWSGTYTRVFGDLTPMEAEHLARDLQRAAETARNNSRPKKKLGDY